MRLKYSLEYIATSGGQGSTGGTTFTHDIQAAKLATDRTTGFPQALESLEFSMTISAQILHLATFSGKGGKLVNFHD